MAFISNTVAYCVCVEKRLNRAQTCFESVFENVSYSKKKTQFILYDEDGKKLIGKAAESGKV